MNHSEMTLAAVQAALLSGSFLQKSFNTAHQIHNKEGIHNLVTESDLKSEELILSFLQKEFPSHDFLSEEDEKNKNPSADILWIIDPLDGTVNFAHHIPHFSISIAAYSQEQQRVLLGVVYQPITQELFVTEVGKGAFLQGNKLSVSKTMHLEQALLATGFPYNVGTNPGKSIERFSSFLHQGLPIRRLGSAAIDLAYLAAGRFDVYWEIGIKAWDIAAGLLLVQEAGGKVSSWEGDPLLILKSDPLSILASNTHLHPVMLQSLQSGEK